MADKSVADKTAAEKTAAESVAEHVAEQGAGQRAQDGAAVRADHGGDAAGAARQASTPRRRAASLVLRLGVVLAAAFATSWQAGSAVQTPLWVAAALAVMWGFRPGRDAVDWVGRTVGLGIAAVILMGPLLDAVGLPLTSRTWAIAVGLLAAIAVLISDVRAPAVPAGSPGSAATGLPGDADGATEEDHPRASARSLLWGGAAAAVVVGALIWGAVSGRPVAPDLEMWLVNPADATSKTTPVKVALRAGVAVPDAQLSVVVAPPAAAPGAAPAAAPSAVPVQTFSIGAGETVEKSVAAPGTGHVEIRLHSASQPGLDRLLVLNR